MAAIKAVVIFTLFVYSINCATFRDKTTRVSVDTLETSDGLQISLKRGDVVTLSGTIGKGLDFTKNEKCRQSNSCRFEEKMTDFILEPIEHGFRVIFETTDLTTEFSDCFDLRVGEINWYGGPERYQQYWPIEKQKLDGDTPYVVLPTDNFAVAEPYWLNSLGSYIYVDRRTPLYIDQNTAEDGVVCFIGKLGDEYVYRERVVLNYTLISFDNPKDAHLYAVNTVLNKPVGPPNEKMVSEPIWTTWAKYKKEIDDQVVRDFADDILNHGFRGGQLEIDDDWENCYGDQRFRPSKFSNISDTVQYLKDNDFRVTLWVHPFVDVDCSPNEEEAIEKGYFVKNTDGSDIASWWNSDNSHQIDFTNPDAQEWYSARLRTLQDNPGIDNFKFDAGETKYVANVSTFNNTDYELWPNILTEEYIRTVAKFGNLIEVRSAYHTQDLDIFVRMLDKDSNWGIDNGLYTLITTLLQMNLNGYSLVLPDMIGGNGYNGQQPSAELLARWTQANTFMPSMQFSYLPWEITSDEFDGLAIVRKYVQLHANYSQTIMKAINASIEKGTPVNPPIWWVDPTDPVALKEDTEYLLGENILVAPVIVENATSRDVYLPRGTWVDGNNGTTYVGPITLTNYPAPIEVLPYFIRRCVCCN